MKRHDLDTPLGGASYVTDFDDCARCDGQWALAELDDGRYCVVHTEPRCVLFEQSDGGDEFLSAQIDAPDPQRWN